MNETIYEQVCQIFVEYFELDGQKLRPEATLFEELALDSMDMVDLAVEMQTRFGFTIDRQADEEKLRSIRTIADLCRLIEEKLKASDIPVPEA
jgi:acyl carrier protein